MQQVRARAVLLEPLDVDELERAALCRVRVGYLGAFAPVGVAENVLLGRRGVTTCPVLRPIRLNV